MSVYEREGEREEREGRRGKGGDGEKEDRPQKREKQHILKVEKGPLPYHTSRLKEHGGLEDRKTVRATGL